LSKRLLSNASSNAFSDAVLSNDLLRTFAQSNALSFALSATLWELCFDATHFDATLWPKALKQCFDASIDASLSNTLC
jgi:hypothetical protein